MKKYWLFLALITCVAGSALANPISLPGDIPIWFDFTNREQISPTGSILAPGQDSENPILESNWGIFVINSIRPGYVTEAFANIENDSTQDIIFSSGSSAQITGMFYGIQLESFDAETGELRSTGGYIDIYWDEPGLVGGGTIVNIGALDDSARTGLGSYPGITDGILLVRLEFASGIDGSNSDITILGSSAGFPGAITGVGSAESYANQLPGGYWDGIFDSDWFRNNPELLGGPLAFGSRDIRFRNTFSNLASWSSVSPVDQSIILGADSSDPATSYTVPEPSTILLLGLGLLGVAGFGLRKKA